MDSEVSHGIAESSHGGSPPVRHIENASSTEREVRNVEIDDQYRKQIIQGVIVDADSLIRETQGTGHEYGIVRGVAFE